MTVADEVLISLALDVMKVDPRAMKTAIIQFPPTLKKHTKYLPKPILH